MDGALSLDDFNKEKVKERLLKTAAEIWGHQPSDMDGFDPIVDLLFGACAVELEKISHEIGDSQARSLEKLANLMIPEIHAMPRPAHIVLHASPSEPGYELKLTDQFYYEKEFSDKENLMKISKKGVYFSPVIAARIFDGSLKYIANGSAIYQCDSPLSKSKVAQANANRQLDAREVWFGLELNDRIDSLKGLFFYFDWNTVTSKSKYQKLLIHTRWYIGDHEIKTACGLKDPISNPRSNPLPNATNSAPEIMLAGGLNQTIETQTIQFYNDTFVTIEDKQKDFQEHQRLYPECFTSIFESAHLEFIEKEILWIKVCFPQSLKNDFIQNGNFAINCFPAINRRLHSSGRPFSLEKEVNTIPLNTDDYFFAVKNVHNNEGNDYKQVNLNDENTQNLDTYSLRSGAVGRFDERNATKILNHALELMRDESIAFKAFDERLLKADIQEVTQTIARLEQAVYKKSKSKDLLYFLLIKPRRSEDVWVEFWSTTGEFGNKIPKGSAYNSDLLDFKKDTIISLSSSSGGRKSLRSFEKVHAFKSILLSRDRYITAEDFRAACFAELGTEIKQVAVKNGVMTSPIGNNGFLRTIDIWLTLSDEFQLKEEEIWAYCHQLKINLEMKAMDICHVRVFISD